MGYAGYNGVIPSLTILCRYFDSFHRAFPILDEGSTMQAYKDDKLPHSLVCELYAVALIAWNTSDKLPKSRPQPDLKYVWRQTVDALNEDFTAPAFHTILAAILDLAGRPTTIMTYNSLNIGRSIALSRSLGLNRDPSSWNLNQRQKSLRIRTWWGILIHDWWYDINQIQFLRYVDIYPIELIVAQGKSHSRHTSSYFSDPV